MKKLILLFVIFLTFSCQRHFVPDKFGSPSLSLTDINVGTTANDGTGDPLRTAFQKVNTNNTLIENALATVYNMTETQAIVADTIQALKENALPLSDYAFMLADSNSYGGAMTYNGVVNYVAANGGTGSGGYEWAEFIVGTTTGAPANADTSLTISAMAGDVIELYRGTTADLHKQWLNETAKNGTTGYRYTSSGEIVVRPAWATSDRAFVKGVASSAVSKLTLSGGASTLLTGLRAGWKMDEISGTQVNDVLTTYTGTTNATVNQTGKFGRAYSYSSASSQITTCGIDVGDLGTNDFSYSCWIYVPTLQSAYNGFIEEQGTVSFYSCVDVDNYIRSVITFDGSTYIHITSNSSITAGNWINVIMTYDRSGNGTMYVDGVAQTDVEVVSSGVTVDIVSNLDWRIGRGGTSTWYFNGSIDDVYLWTKVLTQAEIDDIQTGAYPW